MHVRYERIMLMKVEIVKFSELENYFMRRQIKDRIGAAEGVVERSRNRLKKAEVKLEALRSKQLTGN